MADGKHFTGDPTRPDISVLDSGGVQSNTNLTESAGDVYKGDDIKYRIVGVPSNTSENPPKPSVK